MNAEVIIKAMLKVIAVRKQQLETLRKSSVPHIADSYKNDDNNLSHEIYAMEYLVETDFVEYLAGQISKVEA